MLYAGFSHCHFAIVRIFENDVNFDDFLRKHFRSFVLNLNVETMHSSNFFGFDDN